MKDLTDLSEHCDALASPNPFAVSLAGFLVFGILVSYFPQHAKIIQRRSSEGLSPWWVMLGGLSSIAAIGNILTLPASRADIGCCKVISGGECAAALLGVAQIGCQWTCFMFIVMLYLIYFPTEPDLVSPAASITSTAPPKRRDAVVVGIATLLALLIVGITSIAMVASFPDHTQGWANILGTIAGVLAAIQYLPQIYYTFKIGDIKSLSIITMIIQVPGAFVFAFSLCLRVGWEGWSTWLVYVVTGILQGALLALAISYWLARHNKDKHAEDAHSGVEDEEENIDAMDGAADEEVLPNERTRLLSSGSLSNGRPTPQRIRGSMGTSRSAGSNRQLGMLYAATPPEHDSDSSECSGK